MSLATKPLSSVKAKELILSGDAPRRMTVSGHLDLSGNVDLTELPDDLTVLGLNVSDCVALERLPCRLKVALLRLDNCAKLTNLPADLACQCLEFRNSPLHVLPPELRVTHKLDLTDSVNLAELPDHLCVQTLIVRGCLSLRALPASLDLVDLNIADCSALVHWPSPTNLRLHRLNASNCGRLCALPEGLTIDDSLEIAQSALHGLPASLTNVALRWRGVAVNERIIFRPQSFSAEEIFTEPNLEVRRILIERVGYDWLFKQSKPTILDSDHDAGGERTLRLLTFERDEDLACLSVKCPSTGRDYALRVPPGMRTCRQAAAWLAGFEDSDDYQPVVET